MATRRSSLCKKITFINTMEFVFLINVMDPIKARNVEHIEREGLSGHHYLLNYRTDLFKTDIVRKLMIQH